MEWDYIPKRGDLVSVREHSGRFAIIEVDSRDKTVGMKAVSGDVLLIRDVPWDRISRFDANQIAAWIVAESTKRR
jgi:hypothetical protein